MKKNFLRTTGLLAATVIMFSSCNKKDIEELQSDVDAQNGNIQNLQQVIPTDAGITGTIKGNRGADSVAFTINYDHSFRWDTENDASYLEDNGDGTYDIFIERYASTSSSEYSYIEVYDYDPTIGISSAEVYAYIEESQQADDIQKTLNFWQEGYNYCCGNQITVNSFNLNLDSKAFSISLAINSPEDDGYNSTDNPTTVTMNYSGTLSWEETTYRKAKN